MADFGPKATELSAPQGAGANVVAPATASVGDAIAEGLSTAMSLFSAYNKKDKKDKELVITNSYTRKLTAINDGLRNGTLDPAKASVMSQDAFNSFVSSNPELYEEFAKITEKVKGVSQLGEAEKQIKMERDLRYDGLKSAQAKGYLILPGMTKEDEDKILGAQAASLQVQTVWNDYVKRQEEFRSSARFNQEQADREKKETTIATLNMLGNSNLEAFGAEMNTLIKNVNGGQLKPEDAQQVRSQRFGQILLQIQATSAANPELAGAYRTLFEEVNKTSEKLIDPKTKADTSASELQDIMARAKILALQSDPRVMATYVTKELTPPGVIESLQASSGTAALIFGAFKATPSQSQEYVPSVVKSPDEKQFVNITRQNLKEVMVPKTGQTEATVDSAANTVNNYLKEIGKQQAGPGGISAKELQNAAQLIASPEFGEISKKGKLTQQTLDAAANVFKTQYNQAIINGLNDELMRQVPSAAGKGMVVAADMIDIQSSTAGVKIVSRKSGATGIEQETAARSMVSSERALNQLIHITAHYQGTTDYQKVWEDNKHIFVPALYQTPGLKQGAQKQGKDGSTYEYIGGPELSKASWRKVK